MGLTDMKQSNQSTNEEVTRGPRKSDNAHVKTNGAMLIPSSEPAKIATEDGDNDRSMPSNMWASGGFLSSSRLFQRSSSTPPTHVDDQQGRHEQAMRKGSGAYGLSRLPLRESVEENNQDEEPIELGRQDLILPLGKHLQRSWSAPPVADNLESLFVKQPTEQDGQRVDSLRFGVPGLHGAAEKSRSLWNEEGFDGEKSTEKASVATVSPFGSPLAADRHQDMMRSSNAQRMGAPFPHRGFMPTDKRASGSFMSLVDRVQEDFPRTPSPVFGCPGILHDPTRDMDEQSMVGAMKHLRINNTGRMAPVNIGPRATSRPSERGFVAPGSFQPHGLDLRTPYRGHNQQGFVAPYPTNAPPGFQAPATRILYESPMPSDHRGWARADPPSLYSGDRFPATPSEYGHVSHGSRASFKGDMYAPKFGGVYGHLETPGRVFQGQGPMIYPSPVGYEMPEHHMYNFPQPSPVYRSKSGPSRRNEFPVHPAHSYSATSLLEEFKSAAKADKWDLCTIQGHLVQFARDQAGSRFIQQKLEKADDRAREVAFNEVFPHAMSLMTDVFGNYVIQKFFDHGSIDHQRRLVNLMKKNMISLALQVYGCRVIQKALEVTQVDEQLLLIREMRGHVMKCVLDQNGNHVLQKCIEAASWKKCLDAPEGHRHVLGEDIQFIVDDFIGQAAVLSTHAYGCRVIQRVLEHCSPNQIRPIVNEIMFKCRELVKDQFGNYVVQHVICHGEPDQRAVVMQAILPDVAKWSQHKYASNVVEACLDCANKEEISQIVELILDCDESGASCALLPMMKHMYGNYVVQKLLDRADRHDRQRIVRIIQHNADYLKRFTYGKHVLSRLEREANGNGTSNGHGHGHGRYY